MDAFTLAAKLTLDRNEFDSSMKQVETDLNSEDTKGVFSAWGVAMGNLAAAGIKQIAGAAVDFVKSSIETGMQFDAMMSKVEAIAKPTASEFESLNELAKEMGRTTKFTATEAAEALVYMAQAGWDTEKMMSGLPGVLSLAAAGGTGLGETASIVTNALNAFGMEADQATHFADVLAVAASSADTNISLMGETFKYIAANAGAMNISAEDIAESIGIIANAGIKGSQAGTSLSRILTRIATDAGASEKSLGALGILTEELGVKVYDDAGKFREWSDIIGEARERWQNLTDDQEKMTFAKQIAGQYGIAAWQALMNASVDDVDELRAKIDAADGVAATMSETMLDNLLGDVTILNSAIDGLKLALSDQFTDTLRGFVQGITEDVGKLTHVIRYGFFGDAGIIDLENGLASAEERGNESLAEAESNALKAKSLYDQLAEMSQNVGDSESALQIWQQTANELIVLCPSLASSIDLANGSFTASKDAIYADIEAMEARAKAMALQNVLSDKMAALVKAEGEEINRRVGVMTAQAEFDAAMAPAIEKVNETLAKYGVVFGDNQTAATTVEDLFTALTALDIQGGRKGLTDEEYTELDKLVTNVAEAEGRLNAAKESQENLSSSLSAAQDEYASYAAAVQSMIDELTDYKAAIDAIPDSKTTTLNVVTNNSADGEHAIGAPLIPYDNYVALLHRGEKVLTASQVRQQESAGGGQMDEQAIRSIVRSAMLDLTMQLNDETVGRVVGDSATSRVNNNIGQINRRHRYGYGG